MFHDCQSMRISQREFLIVEFLYYLADYGQLLGSKGFDREVRQFGDEREDLDGSVLVITAQKPAMPFRDH